MKSHYDYLCALLEPMRIYRTERGTLSGSELYAAGEELDAARDTLERTLRESVLMTAEEEGLARRERLFSRCGVLVSPALRRGAIAALGRISTDSFTPAAVNAALSGCGIAARAEETAEKGVVRVWFPGTVGVPEGFEKMEQIILDIIPCHLLTAFWFRYLTWSECEAQGFTWAAAEAAGHSWESFEKAVPQE